MSRFILSPPASDDLDGIIAYLRNLPLGPANRIGKSLQLLLRDIASHPLLGHRHEEYSNLAGSDIRSRVANEYVVYYSATHQPLIILGVIHGKRDTVSIMRERLT